MIQPNVIQSSDYEKWIRENGFGNEAIFYNVQLSAGPTLSSMTAEGVGRLLLAGERLAQVVAQRFGPKHGEPDQEPAGLLLAKEENMENKEWCKIVWVSEITEVQGASNIPLTKQEAESWAADANRRNPGLKHKVVPYNERSKK